MNNVFDLEAKFVPLLEARTARFLFGRSTLEKKTDSNLRINPSNGFVVTDSMNACRRYF